MSADYTWIVEILIGYINGPDFQGETSTYLKNQTILYFDASGNNTTRKNLFNEYKVHFDKTINDFIALNGLKKEHFEHALELILSSEEGLDDVRLSSNLLASREFGVFDLLMSYYYAVGLHEEAIANKEADHIFLDELLGNSELAEINLALGINDCIKGNIEGKKGKKAVPAAPAKPAQVSTPSSSSAPAADPSLFKLTGASSTAGGQLTELSVSTVNAKKDKLQVIESEISQRIAKLREEQEKKIRSMAPELAQSIIAKRKKALASQAAVQAGSAKKGAAPAPQLGKGVGAVPAKKK